MSPNVPLQAPFLLINMYFIGLWRKYCLIWSDDMLLLNEVEKCIDNRQWTGCQKLDTYITAATTWAGRTHSHSDTPLHPPFVGDDPEDLGPTQDSHLFQDTPYPEANIGQVEGPNTFTTTSWCYPPNPLRHLLQGVHWPDGQDAGTSPEGVQESTDIGEHSPVSGSRARSRAEPCDQLEQSKSDGMSSSLPPEMRIGGMAHPCGGPDDEPWCWSLTISVWPPDPPISSLIWLYCCMQ